MNNQQQIDRETELNVFARFFGSLLTQLKHHNLRHSVQSETRPTYISESPIEFIKHVE